MAEQQHSKGGAAVGWAAPTPQEKAQIRVERLDRVVKLLTFNAYSAIPASIVLAALMWGHVPNDRVLMFLVLSFSTTAVLAFMTTLYQGRRAADRDVAIIERWFGPALVLRGASWGLPILIMPVSADDSLLFAVQLLFVVSSAFSNVIVTGPIKEYFHAFQASLIGSAMLGIALSNQPYKIAMIIGCAALYFSSAGLQGPVYDNLVESLVNRRRVERVNKELQRAITQLGQQASHDALTGLSNRVHLLGHLDQILAEQRGTGQQTAVLFVDLDRFKVVNDSLGHAAGDQLLRIVAYRVRQGAGHGALLARLGGDEFIVVVHPVIGNTEAGGIGERVRRALATPTFLEGRDLTITASIGVAISNPNDRSEDLLRHADSALYRAKDLGRNRVEIFDDNLRSALLSRMDDEAELRSALGSGELVPWYQPVVEMQTGKVVGAEVLARWLHSSRGVIPASAFIALAEDTGLIDSISEQVFGRALQNRVDWASEGFGSDFRIRLNVSARQLCRSDSPVRLARALERYECDPAMVSVEVTESGLLGELDHAARQLGEIRSHGIQVSLDDFGTGYSSLALLRQLPLDGVKIDGSFVRDLTTDRRDRAVVGALIRLADELGLEVVAEAVETSEQLDMLIELGCQYGQGYYWSPAGPAPDRPGLLIDSEAPLAG
jgi:diguanylate cyclase (GGDEF)-like protein